EEALGAIDPRTIFYAGVAAHAVAFLVLGTVTEAGVVRATQATGAMLAALLFVSGIYAASRLPDGPIPLRAAGTLHILADTVKTIWKEDSIPRNAARLLHGLAPLIAMFPTFVTRAVVPFGDKLCVGGTPNKPLEWSDVSNVAHAMPGRDLTCSGH